MNCEKYEYLIDDLVEGELDEKLFDEVSLHVFDCQNCNSQFEMLQREKEMYSHYLFEVEPPSNLLDKFQEKLEIHEQQTGLAARSSFRPAIWFSNIFSSLRLNPGLTIAASLILLVFGFGIFNSINEPEPINTSALSKPNFPGIQISPAPFKKADEIDVSATPQKTVEIAKREKSKPETAVVKPIQIKQDLEVKKEKNQVKAAKKNAEPSEEELQLKEIQKLEFETSKQIEKVELLLRSFRNSRLIEGSEIYDISFEKGQARKLLQNNVALRQKAEIYGAIFAEEILNRIEPYLLDIANLEIGSSPDEVLEIKERVKNQNIIASLQGF